MNSHDDADTIELGRPRRPWESYTDKWRLRWQEFPRLTRIALAGGAVIVVAGGVSGAYAATHSAGPSRSPGTTAAGKPAAGAGAASHPEWLKGPHGKPWAEVADGSQVAGTTDVQTGTVTAAGPRSLTIRNSAGRASTYTMTAATQVNASGGRVGSVHEGETVDVIAAREGTSTVALFIENFTS
jgi:hypothetical protein